VYSYEYRRRLPHFQPDFKIFFITFCTYLRWTLPPAAKQLVVDVCVAGNRVKFDLYGLVVMPDHAHIALAPAYLPQGPVPIAGIMQAIKGAWHQSAPKSSGESMAGGIVRSGSTKRRAVRGEALLHAGESSTGGTGE
jgi:hypothetical protein